MLRPVKNEKISAEMTMLGNMWNIVKGQVDTHPGEMLKWTELVELANKLNSVVEQNKTSPELRSFSANIARCIVFYFSSMSMQKDHDDEAKIFNEALHVLKLGYFIKYDGDESEEDWAELMSIAREIPESLSKKEVTPLVDNECNQVEDSENVENVVLGNHCYQFASSMIASVIVYLERLSKERFEKGMDKIEKADGLSGSSYVEIMSNKKLNQTA